MLGMSRSRRHLQSHLPFPPCESPYHHHETKSFSAMPLSQIGTAADSICLKSRSAFSTGVFRVVSFRSRGVGWAVTGRVADEQIGHEWYEWWVGCQVTSGMVGWLSQVTGGGVANGQTIQAQDAQAQIGLGHPEYHTEPARGCWWSLS